MTIARKRVAIVGSGSAGMGALYALRNTNHEVHLFEADDRLGGHTNTLTFTKDGRSTPVDTGFFVLNTATYPNFISMLEHLDVPTVETLMTFSVSRDYGAYEWSGTNLSTVFAQRSNLFSARTWRMVLDIIRFNLSAVDLLSTEPEATTSPSKQTAETTPPLQESLGSYLTRNKYSPSFIHDYLLPMTAAVWSTPPDKCALDFPALTLVRFMWNHHLLSTISARPPWLTIKGGSSTYIGAILKYFPAAQIHLSHSVKSATVQNNSKIILDFESQSKETFDHVILATHGDQARRILGSSATATEAEILDSFTTTPNEAVLHSDMSLMPRRPQAHAAWNILAVSETPSTQSSVSLTYDMTLLQHLDPSFGRILVTLNPPHEPNPKLVQARIPYRHPLYTSAAIAAQSRLPRIQHTRGISYAGAWTRYGFHEDGFSSGVRVAMDALGGKMGAGEWVDSTFVRGRDLGTTTWMKRKTALGLLQVLELWIQGGWLLGVAIVAAWWWTR